MKDPILSGKTTFSMRSGNGQWVGKWIIDSTFNGRTHIHLIRDTEQEADGDMDAIAENVRAEAEMANW